MSPDRIEATVPDARLSPSLAELPIPEGACVAIVGTSVRGQLAQGLERNAEQSWAFQNCPDCEQRQDQTSQLPDTNPVTRMSPVWADLVIDVHPIDIGVREGAKDAGIVHKVIVSGVVATSCGCDNVEDEAHLTDGDRELVIGKLEEDLGHRGFSVDPETLTVFAKGRIPLCPPRRIKETDHRITTVATSHLDS